MNKILSVIFVIICFMSALVPGFGQNGQEISEQRTEHERLITLAVLNVESRLSEEIDTLTLTELIQTELLKQNTFIIVERSAIDKILDEHKLQLSGMTEQEIIQIGMLTGAEKILLSAIAQIGAEYFLIMRYIDATRGEIKFIEYIRVKNYNTIVDNLPLLTERIAARAKGKIIPETKNNVASIKNREHLSTSLMDIILKHLKERIADSIIDKQTARHFSSSANAPHSTSSSNLDTPKTSSESDFTSDRVSIANKEAVKGYFPLQLSLTEGWQLLPSQFGIVGVSISLFSSYNVKVYGYQVGFVCSSGSSRGVSHALVNKTKHDFYGLQQGLINTVGRNVYGSQQGIIQKINNSLYGLQLGILNQADIVHGVQLGVINVCRVLRGVQIGIVNVAEENRLPFMLGINFSLAP